MRQRSLVLALVALLGASIPAESATLILESSIRGGSTSGCIDAKGETLDTGSIVRTECKGVFTVPEEFDFVASAQSVGQLGRVGIAVAATSDELQGDGVFGFANSIIAHSSARISDFVDFSIDSGFFEIPLDLAGTNKFLLGGSLSAGNESSLEIYAYAISFNSFDLAYSFETHVDQVAGVNVVVQEQTGDLGIYTHRIPIINGRAQFGVLLEATSTCASYSSIANSDCTAESLFLSSIRFLGASVFNASGDLENSAFIGSGSGFDYLKGFEPHVSPIPLPATFSFSVLGMISLLAVKRSRNNGRSYS